MGTKKAWKRVQLIWLCIWFAFCVAICTFSAIFTHFDIRLLVSLCCCFFVVLWSLCAQMLRIHFKIKSESNRPCGNNHSKQETPSAHDLCFACGKLIIFYIGLAAAPKINLALHADDISNSSHENWLCFWLRLLVVVRPRRCIFLHLVCKVSKIELRCEKLGRSLELRSPTVDRLFIYSFVTKPFRRSIWWWLVFFSSLLSFERETTTIKQMLNTIGKVEFIDHQIFMSAAIELCIRTHSHGEWCTRDARAGASATQLQHSRFGLRYADNLSSTMKIVFILAKRHIVHHKL